MKILCITIGSAGDVHPFVGIALELQRRGHDVQLATNGHFRRLVESAGLKFIELGSAEEYRRNIENPDLWKPTTAFKAVMDIGVLPLVKKTYELIAREYVPGETLVVASSLAMGARVAQDKLGVPVIMTHLSPALFVSIEDPPVLPPMAMPGWFPKWLRRALMTAAHRFIVDATVGPCINDLRKELGLRPVHRIMWDWWHSPGKTLALFPEWFATASDWPAQLTQTSFPLYDEAGVSHISPALEAFLGDGDAPIAFTAGTAMVHGREFFATSIAAARKIGPRAVLLTRHPEQLPATLPNGVFHADYAPFGEFLPRCALLVHHGGIGTTAQALKAGIPQLIHPLAHDQYDNAHRLKRLGVGDSLKPSEYAVTSAAQMLDRLLTDPTVREAVRKAKARFDGVHPLEETCDEIEAFAGSSMRHRDTEAQGIPL